jgi:hypothetical protein
MEGAEMIIWNGLNVAIDPDSNMGKLIDQAKQKKTTLIVVVVALAVGIILFLRGK